MASIWTLPIVFICENNLYATELLFNKATAGQSVVARAVSYNMPGVEVDGQDILAVYEAAENAIEQARSGKGPTLIECRTYRYVGHHEGDPGTGYRSQEEIDSWKERDPIELFAQRLLDEGKVSQKDLDDIQQDVENTVEDAVEFSDKSPWPSPDEVEEKLFSN
jgi:pyruvate dehydrogenase E1 component alpha subunit